MGCTLYWLDRMSARHGGQIAIQYPATRAASGASHVTGPNGEEDGGVIERWLAVSGRLTVAVVLDALDRLGHRSQAVSPGCVPRTVLTIAIGRAKTLQWTDLFQDDPNTYELELEAIDTVKPGDLVVCATGDSARSGIWGELLTAAAKARGAAGVITDGAVRDIARTEALGFPVYSRHVSPLDSLHRQRVVAYDITVELGGVSITPGDLIIADRDGIAVVPAESEAAVLAAALDKSSREDGFRRAVREGMSLVAAYERFGVL